MATERTRVDGPFFTHKLTNAQRSIHLHGGEPIKIITGCRATLHTAKRRASIYNPRHCAPLLLIPSRDDEGFSSHKSSNRPNANSTYIHKNVSEVY